MFELLDLFLFLPVIGAAVLTNLGENWVAGRLEGSDTSQGQHGHWGTGAGTAAKTDTNLFTPATEARVAGTVTKTGSGSSAKYQNIFTLTADAGKTITNAGTWDAAGSGSPPTGGNLLTHWDHGNIVLAQFDQIQYTLTLDPA